MKITIVWNGCDAYENIESLSRDKGWDGQTYNRGAESWKPFDVIEVTEGAPTGDDGEPDYSALYLVDGKVWRAA